MMPIKASKNWNDCIIFCYKKNLEISFQNGPEHETTSLRYLHGKLNSYIHNSLSSYFRLRENSTRTSLSTRLISGLLILPSKQTI